MLLQREWICTLVSANKPKSACVTTHKGAIPLQGEAISVSTLQIDHLGHN